MTRRPAFESCRDESCITPDYVIPANAGIHFASALGFAGCVVENSRMGPSVRWDDGARIAIPAQAGTQCLSLPAHDGDARRTPGIGGDDGLVRETIRHRRTVDCAGHNFATHLDSVAPQRAPMLIHMLVDRPSTPGVENPETRRSWTGQNFATHLDSPAAQGAGAVIHTVSPTSFHSECGKVLAWNTRPFL